MRVFAAEISPEKIAFAGSIGVHTLDEADLTHRSFDIVHTELVVEHLAHPADIFALLANSVASGGLLKLAMPRRRRIKQLIARTGVIDRSPDEQDFTCGAYNDYNATPPLEHLNAFCRTSVEALARRHDRVVENGSFGGNAAFLDTTNRVRLRASARQSLRRLLEEIYVRLVPGRLDTGCYVLVHRT